MKLIKLLFTIISGIACIFLIVAAFAPTEYAIKRDIVVNKSKDEVFAYIKQLKNMDNYSVWAKMDPDMEKTYQGADGQVGFIAAWDSENEMVGRGEQEIVKIVEGERINTVLRFYEPFEATDDAYFTTEALDPRNTKITWGFSGGMSYPTNIMLLIMDMEKELGGHLANSLKNLKVILEK